MKKPRFFIYFHLFSIRFVWPPSNRMNPVRLNYWIQNGPSTTKKIIWKPSSDVILIPKTKMQSVIWPSFLKLYTRTKRKLSCISNFVNLNWNKGQRWKFKTRKSLFTFPFFPTQSSKNLPRIRMLNQKSFWSFGTNLLTWTFLINPP